MNVFYTYFNQAIRKILFYWVVYFVDQETAFVYFDTPPTLGCCGANETSGKQLPWLQKLNLALA